MNHKNRGIPLAISLTALVLAVVLAGSFLAKAKRPAETHGFAMGAVITQRLSGPGTEAVGKQILSAVQKTEQTISWRVEESETAQVNQSNGTPVPVSEEMAAWLEQGKHLSQDSAGAFDLTVGALTSLWDFDGGRCQVPDSAALQQALSTVGSRFLSVSEERAVLSRQGTRLDFGSVGKGIACDAAHSVLKKSPLQWAVVSVGGSVLVWSREGKDRAQTIAVRNPFGGENESFATLQLTNSTVSTSGNYEKYFIKDQVRYHHLLDPKTGMPAQNDLAGVTVVCESGFYSDGLSTACYVLGMEKSLPLLEKYRAQAVFVTNEKRVWVTQGLAKQFSLTDQEFTYEVIKA